MAHWQARFPVEIRQLAECLYAISASNLSAKGHRSQLHSYFLVRSAGNLLFHGPDRVPLLKEHRSFFDRHGGIAQQVLTHGGDASRACRFVEQTWGAPVFVNRWELDEARARSGLAIPDGVPNDHPVGPDVEALHLPGHAVGFTAYRFALEGRRYLLFGHFTREMSPGSWGTYVPPALLDSGVRSLERLRALDVDLLLCDRTLGDRAPPLPFGPAERAAVVSSTLEYLSKKHEVSLG
jgi:glyoxylase-like metal-dependent hydrolase (beta-lactamase superfamily II)